MKNNDIELKPEGSGRMIGDIPLSLYKFGWIIIIAIILIVVFGFFTLEIPYTEGMNLWEIIFDKTYINANSADVQATMR
ncbi:MAG: hypothetical protein HDR92_00880 [Bacteroides sp.]|nr:hypothetical protein [Bacteroides sp.]